MLSGRVTCNGKPVKGATVNLRSSEAVYEGTSDESGYYSINLTCVNPLGTTFTHYGNTRHIDEDILCLLEVPVKVTIQSIAEESEVETKVGLCGRLPLDIVVTYLITLETRSQGATTIGTCGLSKCLLSS